MVVDLRTSFPFPNITFYELRPALLAITLTLPFPLPPHLIDFPTYPPSSPVPLHPVQDLSFHIPTNQRQESQDDEAPRIAVEIRMEVVGNTVLGHVGAWGIEVGAGVGRQYEGRWR